jgi:pyruvate/2-oxoglutarate/acetoin dehydrogenase E1 component/TPP-dependent pyruvate/acetoin dehydrogenase alpha subunit
MEIEKEKQIDMYRIMVRHREFEDRLVKEFSAGRIPGFLHLSQGQEAIAAGAMAALEPNDYILTHHRAHGHLLAKGGKADLMMAEIYGKETGYNKGKGGSVHLAGVDVGVLGAQGIVGAGITIAAGAALSAQMRRTNQVTICFIGDGATNTSRFHEGVNLAAIWKLPVVYVIENNAYAESTHISYAVNIPNIADRAQAYGIPGISIDGNDVLAVYEAVSEAVTRARKGEGPTLLELKTCRWGGHYTGDPQVYRSKEEIAECMKRDPIKRFRQKLIEMKLLAEKEVANILKEAAEEMKNAVTFAEESPLPDPEDTLKEVYVNEAKTSKVPHASRVQKMKEITFLKAVTEAVDEEMARDPSVFVIGEDVRIWGAPRGEFKGLVDKYGLERVRDTPISETAILGSAIGAAATGMRPIANIMYANFLGVCGDELINQLTKMRYMLGGKIKMPVTIMSYSGAGCSTGAHHANNLYGLLMNVTALKIVVPSTPYDAKGLLKSAIREDNPTIFLSHQMLMRRDMKNEVPDEEYTIPLGQADIKRKGSDVTVVAIGLMVQRALSAAEQLQEKGLSVEVIDPRTLVPLDKQTIIDSVRRTGRLVIMDEEPITGSAAAEIAAVIVDEAFDLLDAPVKRVCAPDTPIPFSPVLEKFWMPDEEDLIRAITEIT